MTNVNSTGPVSGGSIPPAPTLKCVTCGRYIEYIDHNWTTYDGWTWCDLGGAESVNGYLPYPAKAHTPEDPLAELVKNSLRERGNAAE